MIKENRIKTGYTQEQLAEKLIIHKTIFLKYENGFIFTCETKENSI